MRATSPTARSATERTPARRRGRESAVFVAADATLKSATSTATRKTRHHRISFSHAVPATSVVETHSERKRRQFVGPVAGRRHQHERRINGYACSRRSRNDQSNAASATIRIRQSDLEKAPRPIRSVRTLRQRSILKSSPGSQISTMYMYMYLLFETPSVRQHFPKAISRQNRPACAAA